MKNIQKVLLVFFLCGFILNPAYTKLVAAPPSNVTTDTTNNCYFGSVDFIQQTLGNINKNFENDLKISEDTDATLIKALVSNLGQLKGKEKSGSPILPSDIDDLLNSNADIISKLHISANSISASIQSKDYNSILADLNSFIDKTYDSNPFYTTSDFQAYLRYVFESSFLSYHQDKSKCIGNTELEYLDKLKEDLNQENIVLSQKNLNLLILSRQVLETRVGIAFFSTVGLSDFNNADYSADSITLLTISDNKHNLIIEVIPSDKKLNIIISKDGEVIQTFPILKDCREQLFFIVSIEKSYHAYSVSVSVRQFLSNRRDRIIFDVEKSFIEGSIFHLSDKIIVSSETRYVTELRCCNEDDYNVILVNELEILTQMITQDIRDKQDRLSKDCLKIDIPDCEYAEKERCDCKAPKVWDIINKICVTICPDKTFKNSVTGDCESCETGCSKCDDKGKCKTGCQKPRFLYKERCVVYCPNGTYVVKDSKGNNHCEKCHETCEKCEDGDSCEECANGLLLDPADKKCKKKCDDGTFPSPSNQYCLKCPWQHCVTCDSDKCIHCDENGYIWNVATKICEKECSQGTYLDTATNTCKLCDDPCKNCDKDSCIICKNGFELKGKICIPICATGYTRRADGTCFKCDDACASCNPDKPNQCYTCDLPKFLDGDTCVSSCPDRTVYNKNTKRCESCRTNCLACNEDKSCNVCEDSYFLDENGHCVNPCQAGWYGDKVSKKCLPCHNSCRVCTNGDKCVNCPSGSILDPVDGLCKKDCPPNTERVGDNCIACQSNCVKCESPCTQCDKGYSLINGNCVKDCPPGTIDVNGVCKACDDNHCVDCGKNPGCCLKCQENYLLQGCNCVKDCTSCYFQEDEECMKCPVDCVKCKDAHTCIICDSGLYLTKDGKCEPCGEKHYVDNNGLCKPCSDPDCKKCPGDKCIECLTKLVFNYKCEDCPDGFLPSQDKTRCVPCETECKKCDGTPKNCTQCSPGQIPDENNNCKYPDCNIDQYKDADGKCVDCSTIDPKCKQCKDKKTCFKCEDPYVLDADKKKCVVVCGPGFYLVSNACHPCTEHCVECNCSFCKKCEQGYVLKDYFCVKDCGVGFFMDEINNCVPCSPDCKTCTDPTKCDSCIDGKVLYKDECLYQCPDATYVKNQKECVKCNIENCKKCSDDGEICLECYAGFYYDNTLRKCVKFCDDGKAPVNGSCIKCTVTECNDCSGNVDLCDDCKAPNFLFFNIVTKKEECRICPEGYWGDTQFGRCRPCVENCAKCHCECKCDACLPGFYLNGKNNCVEYCADGTTRDNVSGRCKTCTDTECFKCADNGLVNHCEVCNDGYYLDENHKCLNECPAGYYADKIHKKCIKCSLHCLKCDETGCLECDTANGWRLENKYCLNDCPTGTFKDENGKCVTCLNPPEFCKHCQNNKCVECEKSHPFLIDNKCHAECPNGTYVLSLTECKSCGEYCEQCKSDVECIKCGDGYFRAPGPKGSKVEICVKYCDNGTKPVDGVCKRCTILNCKKCNNSLDSCDECESGWVRQKNSDGNYHCVKKCDSDKWKDTLECKPCNDPHCANCDNSLTCDGCKPPKVLFNNVECIDDCRTKGAYVAVDGHCKPCHDPKCDKCDTEDHCLKCKIGYIVIDGVCKISCPPKTFRVKDECISCQVDHCANCEKDEFDCTKCDDKYYLTDNKTCLPTCPDGSVPTNGSCIKCTVQYCKTCDSVGTCIICNDGYKLSADQKECVKDCKDKEILQDGNCKSCPSNQQPLNEVCVCPSPFVLNDNKDCVLITICPEGTFKSGNDCIKCVDNCNHCKDNKDCDICEKGFYKYQGKCIQPCPEYTYHDESKLTCEPCKIHCKICTSRIDCQVCEDNYILQNDVCVMKCDDGYVPVGSECQKCKEPNCDYCKSTDLESCVFCEKGYKLYNGRCLPECPPGTYIHVISKGEECLDCNKNCDYCPNLDRCHCCIPPFVVDLDGKTCILNCPEKSVEVDRKCVPCGDKHCLTCASSNVDYCIICESPFVQQDNKCVLVCKTDEYLDPNDHTCHKCTHPCITCTSQASCTRCDKGWLLVGDVCKPECPGGQAPDSVTGKCQSCVDTKCIKCDNPDVDLCKVCEKYKYKNQCLDECPVLTYPDSNKDCLDCNRLCKTSCNENGCNDCILPYTLVELKDGKRECQIKCKVGETLVGEECVPCTIKDCASCPDKDTCVYCIPPMALSEDKKSCSIVCEIGTYLDGDQCLPCKHECTTCHNNCNCSDCKLPLFKDENGNCVDECKERYYISLIPNKHCERCSDPDCLECDSTGAICKKCETLYLLNGKCVNCPPKTFPCIPDKTCIPCIEHCDFCHDNTSCDRCEKGYHLKNNKCVKDCGDGYVENDNGDCVACEKCKTCLVIDPKECTNCVNNQFLYKGKCLDYCKDGTKPTIDDKGIAICVTCKPNCRTCDDLGCTSCFPPLILKDKDCIDVNGPQNPSEPCISPKVMYKGVCSSCTDYNCQICRAENPDLCQICKPGFVLDSDYNCVEICQPGYYKDVNNVCVQCNKHCIICEDNTGKCKECEENYFPDESNLLICDTCVAPSVVVNGVCTPCHAENCKVCDKSKPSGDICKTCIDRYFWDKELKKCVPFCINGKYPDGTVCKNCSQGCKLCQNDKDCDECNPGLYLKDGKCVKDCGNYYFKTVENGKNVCKPCSDKHCVKCPNDKCEECFGNYIMVNGICSESCPKSSFYDVVTKACVPCASGCSSCDKSGGCVCASGFYKKDGICVPDCGDGYESIDGKTCTPCTDKDCLKCKFGKCEACDKPLVLENNKCVLHCLTGYFARNGVCVKCIFGCDVCEEEAKCKVCSKNLVLLEDGICGVACDNGSTRINGICQSCDVDNCKRCVSGDINTCAECNAPFALRNGRCVKECGDDEFKNELGVCVKCTRICGKCDGKPEDCVFCDEGFKLIENRCVNLCPDGHVKIDGKDCEVCTTEHCNACNIHDICIKCTPPFMLNAESKCVTDCADGFYADEHTGECYPCGEGCEVCDYHGCNRCNENYYLQDNACVEVCLVGFIGNCDTLLCEQCHSSCKTCSGSGEENCMDCAEDFHRLGNICYYKNNCPKGYFADTVNKACTACGQEHCAECLNAVTCRTCDVGYHNDNGNCSANFAIKPVFSGNLIISKYTQSNYPNLVATNDDIDNILLSSSSITVTLTAKSLSSCAPSKTGQTSSLLKISTKSNGLSLKVIVDRDTKTCGVQIIKDGNAFSNLTGADCSESVLSAGVNIVASFFLADGSIAVNLFVNGNIASKDFSGLNIKTLTDADTLVILSDDTLSNAQCHQISNVFVSNTIISNKAITDFVSKEIVEEAEEGFVCRNVNSCSGNSSHFLLASGLVHANDELIIKNSVAVKLNSAAYTNFAVEAIVYSVSSGRIIEVFYPEDINGEAISALKLVVSSSNNSDFAVGNGVITIPQGVAKGNWYKVYVSIIHSEKGTKYSVSIFDSVTGDSVYTKSLTIVKEYLPKLTTDAAVSSDFALLGLAIHVGDVENAKLVLPNIRNVKEDFHCSAFDVNAVCSACISGFNLVNGICVESALDKCSEIFEYAALYSNDSADFAIAKAHFTNAKISIVLRFRRLLHSIVSSEISQNLVSIRTVGYKYITVLSHTDSPDFKNVYTIGSKTLSVDESNIGNEFNTLVITVDTSSFQATATLFVGDSSISSQIALSAFNNIFLGDRTKSQINVEFKSGLVCEKEVTSAENFSSIPESDAACLDADVASGKCRKCINGGVNENKCNPSVLGFHNSYVSHLTNSADSGAYVFNLKDQIPNNVNSIDYLVAGRFTIPNNEADGSYEIFRLENNPQKAPLADGNPSLIFKVVATIASGVGKVSAFFNTAADNNVEVPIPGITLSQFSYVSIHVDVANNKVEVIGGSSGVISKTLAGKPEKLQSSAQFSLFGIRDSNRLGFIGEAVNLVLVPNVNGDSTKVNNILQTSDQFQISSVASVTNCAYVAQNGKCVECAHGFEKSNETCGCVKSNSISTQGYKCIYTGVFTNGASTYDVENPFDTFNLCFHLRLNYPKFNTIDTLINAGTLQIAFLKDKNNFFLKFMIGKTKFMTSPLSNNAFSGFISVCIALQETKTVIYIRDNAGNLLETSDIAAGIPAPSDLNLYNADNSCHIANVHLTQIDYGKPAISAPKNGSIYCDIYKNGQCVSADNGTEDGKVLGRFLKVRNFGVIESAAPVTVPIQSILDRRSGLSSTDFTIKFSVALLNDNLTKDCPTLIQVLKVVFGENYISIKIDVNRQDFVIEYKNLDSTIKNGAKDISNLSLPYAPENHRTSVLVSVDEDSIIVLLYNAANNYIHKSISTKGFVDRLTANSILEFGYNQSNSNSYILSITDLAINPEKDFTLTELYALALEVNTYKQLACLYSSDISITCDTCDRGYAVVKDNNNDSACALNGGSAFANSINHLVHISESLVQTVKFDANSNVSSLSFSINISNPFLADRVVLASVSLDSTLIFTVASSGFDVTVENAISGSFAVIRDAFVATHGVSIYTLNVFVDLENGITSAVIGNLVTEEFRFQDSFGNKSSGIQTSSINVTLGSNSSDSASNFDFVAGAIVVVANPDSGITSDDYKLLSIQQEYHHTTCQEDYTRDGLGLCNKGSVVNINFTNTDKLVNRLDQLIKKFKSTDFISNLKIDIEVDVNKYLKSSSSNVNANVLLAIDSYSDRKASDLTHDDILPKSHYADRVALILENSRLYLTTNVRSIDILDSAFNFEDYNRIYISLVIDAYNETIEVRILADDLIIKRLISIPELAYFNFLTSFYSNKALTSAILSLNDNPGSNYDDLDCTNFKIKRDHCNIDNCATCLLGTDGKKYCLQCHRGYVLCKNGCAKGVVILDKSFIGSTS